MTPQEAIAELKRRGVLTWEAGDVAVLPSALPHGTIRIINQLHLFEGYIEILGTRYDLNDCTHSVDDPRLLGRVLRELEGGPFMSVSIDYAGGYNHVRLFRHPWKEGNSISKEGDTLLEAALKAWLKKVEGEQS